MNSSGKVKRQTPRVSTTSNKKKKKSGRADKRVKNATAQEGKQTDVLDAIVEFETQFERSVTKEDEDKKRSSVLKKELSQKSQVQKQVVAENAALLKRFEPFCNYFHLNSRNVIDGYWHNVTLRDIELWITNEQWGKLAFYVTNEEYRNTIRKTVNWKELCHKYFESIPSENTMKSVIDFVHFISNAAAFLDIHEVLISNKVVKLLSGFLLKIPDYEEKTKLIMFLVCSLSRITISGMYHSVTITLQTIDIYRLLQREIRFVCITTGISRKVYTRVCTERNKTRTTF
jgi:hypothetical protein